MLKPASTAASDADAALPDGSRTALPGPRHVRVGPLQPVAELLREHGVDPASVLLACGLPADTLADADRRIAFRNAGCLVQRAAWALQRADFGLLVGQRFELSCLGLLGELMRQAPTVGAALQNMSRYFHLQDRGSVPYLRQVDPDLAALGYSIYDSDMPGAGLAYDMVLAIAMAILRALCGPTFRAVELHLAHRAPAVTQPYRRCFAAPVVFDAPHSELHFDARWLGAPVAGSDPSALDAARRVALDAGAGETRDWSERAHAAVRVLVMHGSLSGARVAEALGLHERTLRRRIADEGSSLQAIVTQARFDIARQLLRETRLPMAELAATLGFSDPTAFVRAFRGWAGCTPGRWRDACQGEAGAS